MVLTKKNLQIILYNDSKQIMELLKELTIILAFATIVVFICSKIKIPSIVGFLITGVATGPFALKLISNLHDVEVLAEIGVILLLFTIGLEFSIKSLMRIKKAVLLGGSFQVFITISVVFFIFYLFNQSWQVSLFYGFLVSLSSTAIVLKLLQQRSEVDTPHGRSSLAILIFQDVIVVPMLLLTPIIAGRAEVSATAMGIFLLKTIGVLLFIYISAKWLVPWFFHQVTASKSKELFILSIVVLCFSIALLTYIIGLSLALGAFIAGLIVSRTEYSHEAISTIMPFRDIFTSVFFVSIGMLLDVQTLIPLLPLVIALTAGVIILKSVIIIIGQILFRMPLKNAIQTALALCQVGEFSFILFKTGMKAAIIGKQEYQIFLGVSILSMLSAPFIISGSAMIANLIEQLPLPSVIKKGLSPLKADDDSIVSNLQDHTIIIGYGVNGRNLARSAELAHIPYVIIEMNPDTVRTGRQNGEPFVYGDASNDEVLLHVKIKQARVLVAAIPDAAATRRIVQIARKLNPLIYIVARTRYVLEVQPLSELGASEVIPEEFETSVEIFTRVLKHYNVPLNDIQNFSATVRSNCYTTYRENGSHKIPLLDAMKSLAGVEFISVRIESDSHAENKRLNELQVRKNFKVSIAAIISNNIIDYNPAPETKIKTGDILVLFGEAENLSNAYTQFVS